MELECCRVRWRSKGSSTDRQDHGSLSFFEECGLMSASYVARSQWPIFRRAISCESFWLRMPEPSVFNVIHILYAYKKYSPLAGQHVS